MMHQRASGFPADAWDGPGASSDNFLRYAAAAMAMAAGHRYKVVHSDRHGREVFSQGRDDVQRSVKGNW